jgi:hypothetical protein
LATTSLSSSTVNWPSTMVFSCQSKGNMYLTLLLGAICVRSKTCLNAWGCTS